MFKTIDIILADKNSIYAVFSMNISFLSFQNTILNLTVTEEKILL